MSEREARQAQAASDVDAIRRARADLNAPPSEPAEGQRQAADSHCATCGMSFPDHMPGDPHCELNQHVWKRALAAAEARGHARGAAEAAALRERVEGLAAEYAVMAANLHSVPHAETFRDVTADLRRALGGES